MGSVIEYIECPDCGSEAYNEFYYKSGEEFIICNHCGYSRKFFIKNMEDQDKESEFEWVPDFELEEVHGCGAYKIRYKDTLAYECGAFAMPEAIDELVRLIEERKDELAHAEYSTFIDGVLAKHILIQEELDNTNE